MKHSGPKALILPSTENGGILWPILWKPTRTTALSPPISGCCFIWIKGRTEMAILISLAGHFCFLHVTRYPSLFFPLILSVSLPHIRILFPPHSRIGQRFPLSLPQLQKKWEPRCKDCLLYTSKERSAIARFKVKGEEAYILAWTTTPWTLPSNVALCVNPNEDYVKV